VTLDAATIGLLGAAPGLCAGCRHARVNVTRRGTAYLRCGRAAWDPRMARYPRLPVRECPGFEQGEPDNPARSESQ
jgi:hypothetical protein